MKLTPTSADAVTLVLHTKIRPFFADAVRRAIGYDADDLDMSIRRTAAQALRDAASKLDIGDADMWDDVQALIKDSQSTTS